MAERSTPIISSDAVTGCCQRSTAEAADGIRDARAVEEENGLRNAIAVVPDERVYAQAAMGILVALGIRNQAAINLAVVRVPEIPGHTGTVRAIDIASGVSNARAINRIVCCVLAGQNSRIPRGSRNARTIRRIQNTSCIFEHAAINLAKSSGPIIVAHNTVTSSVIELTDSVGNLLAIYWLRRCLAPCTIPDIARDT